MLVLAGESKKEGVRVLEFAPGRVSKFVLVGSNRMLVV